MNRLLAAYQSYLQEDLRLHPDIVAGHMQVLPEVLDPHYLVSPAELTGEHVRQIWRQHRWERTESGICARDISRSRSLAALRFFLRYLKEESGAISEALHDIIQVPEVALKRVGGLTPEERKQVDAMLRYNINTCNQRRETALIYLLLTSGLSLESLLKLEAGSDGLIAPEVRSGNFTALNGTFFLMQDDAFAEVPDQVIHFLNFYLENRRYRNPLLFIKGSGRDAAGPWHVTAALRAVTRFFKRCGITVPRGRLLDVLKETAITQKEGQRPQPPRTAQLTLPFSAPLESVSLQFPADSRAA